MNGYHRVNPLAEYGLFGDLVTFINAFSCLIDLADEGLPVFREQHSASLLAGKKQNDMTIPQRTEYVMNRAVNLTQTGALVILRATAIEIRDELYALKDELEAQRSELETLTALLEGLDLPGLVSKLNLLSKKVRKVFVSIQEDTSGNDVINNVKKLFIAFPQFTMQWHEAILKILINIYYFSPLASFEGLGFEVEAFYGAHGNGVEAPGYTQMSMMRTAADAADDLDYSAEGLLPQPMSDLDLDLILSGPVGAASQTQYDQIWGSPSFSMIPAGEINYQWLDEPEDPIDMMYDDASSHPYYRNGSGDHNLVVELPGQAEAQAQAQAQAEAEAEAEGEESASHDDESPVPTDASSEDALLESTEEIEPIGVSQPVQRVLRSSSQGREGESEQSVASDANLLLTNRDCLLTIKLLLASHIKLEVSHLANQLINNSHPRVSERHAARVVTRLIDSGIVQSDRQGFMGINTVLIKSYTWQLRAAEQYGQEILTLLDSRQIQPVPVAAERLRLPIQACKRLPSWHGSTAKSRKPLGLKERGLNGAGKRRHKVSTTVTKAIQDKLDAQDNMRCVQLGLRARTHSS